MRANKYIRTGLRDRNGIEIKAGNIVQTKRVGIEYSAGKLNVIINIDQYEVVFDLGCFFLRLIDLDHHEPLPLYYFYTMDGNVLEYTEQEIYESVDRNVFREPWDVNYNEEKESLKTLLNDLGMTIDELIQDCKIEIIFNSYKQILRS